MAITLFSHVALACKDMAATEQFYCDHFGFRRVRAFDVGGGEQIVFLKMQECAVYLELFQAKGESPVPPFDKDGPAYPGVRHLAFKVDDVDGKLQELGDAAKVTLGPAEFDGFIPGWRTVWIADPDGNIIEISQGFADE